MSLAPARFPQDLLVDHPDVKKHEVLKRPLPDRLAIRVFNPMRSGGDGRSDRQPPNSVAAASPQSATRRADRSALPRSCRRHRIDGPSDQADLARLSFRARLGETNSRASRTYVLSPIPSLLVTPTPPSQPTRAGETKAASTSG